MALPPGLYEAPITQRLDAAFKDLAPELVCTAALNPDEVPELLARALTERLAHSIKAIGGDDRRTAQLQLANAVLELLEAQSKAGGAEEGDHFSPAAQKLLAILTPSSGLGTLEPPARPGLPLSTSELITNGRRDLNIGREIQKELASADRVDLLCSFLKYSGVRLVKDALTALNARHPGAIRILTTTYMGATEQRALDAPVLRHPAHAPAREGLALSPSLGLLDRAHRLLEPIAQRDARRPRMERPCLGHRQPRRAEEVRDRLRPILERPRLRALRDGSDRSAAHCKVSRR